MYKKEGRHICVNTLKFSIISQSILIIQYFFPILWFCFGMFCIQSIINYIGGSCGRYSLKGSELFLYHVILQWRIHLTVQYC